MIPTSCPRCGNPVMEDLTTLSDSRGAKVYVHCSTCEFHEWDVPDEYVPEIPFRKTKPRIPVPAHIPARVEGCGVCARSMLGACSRHQGVTPQQRQALWREARRQAKASA